MKESTKRNLLYLAFFVFGVLVGLAIILAFNTEKIIFAENSKTYSEALSKLSEAALEKEDYKDSYTLAGYAILLDYKKNNPNPYLIRSIAGKHLKKSDYCDDITKAIEIISENGVNDQTKENYATAVQVKASLKCE